jgi:hypothetical protein
MLKPLPNETNIFRFMSACSLRESNRIGWMHAIVFFAIGVRQLRETSRMGVVLRNCLTPD